MYVTMVLYWNLKGSVGEITVMSSSQRYFDFTVLLVFYVLRGCFDTENIFILFQR